MMVKSTWCRRTTSALVGDLTPPSMWGRPPIPTGRKYPGIAHEAHTAVDSGARTSRPMTTRRRSFWRTVHSHGSSFGQSAPSTRSIAVASWARSSDPSAARLPARRSGPVAMAGEPRRRSKPHRAGAGVPGTNRAAPAGTPVVPPIPNSDQDFVPSVGHRCEPKIEVPPAPLPRPGGWPRTQFRPYRPCGRRGLWAPCARPDSEGRRCR